jgi:hypothetical protein
MRQEEGERDWVAYMRVSHLARVALIEWALSLSGHPQNSFIGDSALFRAKGMRGAALDVERVALTVARHAHAAKAEDATRISRVPDDVHGCRTVSGGRSALDSATRSG